MSRLETPRRRRPRRWTRWLRRVLIGLALLVLIPLAALLFYTNASLPDYDGEARIPGLSAPVTIVRDARAVPHIFAQTMDDAYRALGYAHAQDRLFQMEMIRRVGAGRLAEATGGFALRIDRLMRLLDIYGLAEASVANASPEARRALAAYAEGVNARIDEIGWVLPPEFLLLGIRPQPWRPADSAVWGRLMALQLSGNWRTEIERARLAKILTEAQMRDLWPGPEEGEPTTLGAVQGRRSLYAGLRRAGRGLAEPVFRRLARALPDTLFAFADASNEWVVGGARTTSGLPLLANDPHLGFTAPGLWYLARIVTPEATIVGATVPGVPFTVLGRNSRIAWGFTTTHADVQDLFIERIDPADAERYLTPDGSKPFVVRTSEIKVRFRGEPERFVSRWTRHGPVVSDLGGEEAGLGEEGEVVALAFTGLARDDRTVEALYRLNRAQNWEMFTDAMRDFQAPPQNVAYADITGRIGFRTGGRIPLRRAVDARPVPGWSGAFDWLGTVPFADMPAALDPPSGIIVNANNRVTRAGDAPFFAADWPSADRAARITSLLATTERHGVESMAAIQRDIVSLPAHRLVPRLLAAAAGRPPTHALAGEALAKLRAWDGAMDRNRAEPLIFMAWLRALGAGVYGDELRRALGGDTGRGVRLRALEHMLDDAQSWCDDIATEAVETCDEQMVAAFDSALTLVAERLGDDIGTWRWGALHRARFANQILGRLPLIGSLANITVETDGGPYTVNRGSPSLTGGPLLFAHVHGPGYRAIYDLSDLKASRFIIATGQSGHPLSRHYDDLTQLWADGRSFTLTGTQDALKAGARGTTRLTP